MDYKHNDYNTNGPQKSSEQPYSTYNYNANQKLSPATPLVPPSGEGKWRSSLCACFSDCCICCSVCCCHPITTGQLYERAVQKAMLNRLPMVSCLTIALVIFVMETAENVTSYIFSSAHYQVAILSAGDRIWEKEYWLNVSEAAIGAGETTTPASHHAEVMLGVSEMIGFMSMLCVCAIVCTVRAAVRRRDNIPSKCCGALEDCCCACCCNPCTQCMLLRHEKESSPIGSDGYSLCHPTAIPL